MENGGDGKLKNYECIEIRHHRDVAKTIEEYERNGWHGCGPNVIYRYSLLAV